MSGKKNKPADNKKDTVGRSIAFSKSTAEIIDKMASLPQYRNNRSMVVETLITTNPMYKKFVKSKK